VNGHQTAQALHLEVSNFIDGRHVVVANLEATALAVSLKADVTHKLTKGLAKERLKAMVLLHQLSHKIEACGIIKAELQ
jgi:hypothetical protein